MSGMLQVKPISVCPMKGAYAISTVVIDGKTQVIAATEDHGPAVLIDPDTWSATDFVPGPGGCMSIVQMSEQAQDKSADRGRRPGAESLYAIFGCFPGYDFHGAAVYRIQRSLLDAPFTVSEIFRLPFAHRLTFVEKDGVEYLIAANLAANKESPEDWSLPGSLLAAPVPQNLSDDWEPATILDNLHKNHCMFAGRLDGERVMLIGGQEGLYCFDLESSGPGWSRRMIVDHEVSEAVLFDIDRDGADELITIEPFHGNRLAVYRREHLGESHGREIGAAGLTTKASLLDNSRLRPVFEAELAYGHGLWAGLLAGSPALVVGNRSGNQNLEIFVIDTAGTGLVRETVAEGVGSANTVVLGHAGATWIVATNQGTEQVAAYRIDSLNRD